MNIKQLFSSFSSTEDKEPLVRIDGSLSGNAMLDRDLLLRLKETVEAVSSNRPYTYDIDFGGGRFTIIVVESAIPKSAFIPDPERAMSQDLQNFLNVLPPEERTKASSSFRIMWSEGGDVSGIVFQIKAPGRIVSEQRIRPEEEYDRITEKQAGVGINLRSNKRLPLWGSSVLIILLVAFGSVLYYFFSPDMNFSRLELILKEKIEMTGFEDLIRIDDPETSFTGVKFVVTPCEAYSDRLAEALNPVDKKDRGAQLKKLAAEALLKGRLNIEIIDQKDMLIRAITFSLLDFDGSEPVTVEIQRFRLTAEPGRIRITP